MERNVIDISRDVEDGRRLLKKYLSHIKETYDKNDKEPDDALISAQRTLRAKGYSPDKWAPFVILN